MNKTPQKKNKVGLFLSWFFGISAALNAIVYITESLFASFLFIIIAATLIPPVNKFIQRKAKLKLSNGVTAAILTVSLFLVYTVIGDNNATQELTPEVPTKTSEVINKVEKELQITTPENKKTLDVSYAEMMNYLSSFFTMEKTTSVDEADRYLGQTPNNLAFLEIIGKKENISSTSLMMGIPSDNPEAVIENAAIALRFLKNVFPEWADSDSWLNTSIIKINTIPDKTIEHIYENKKITIALIDVLNVMTITITAL